MRYCGTWSAYAGGCRCPECRDAAARVKHRLRHGSGPHPHICWFCPRTFLSAHGASVHMGKVH